MKYNKNTVDPAIYVKVISNRTVFYIKVYTDDFTIVLIMRQNFLNSEEVSKSF